jgi:hypothetical protein
MPRLQTQSEIILVNGSTFANRQYAEKNNNPEKKDNYLSKHESLKKACWDGMLKEMIPELFFMFTPDTKLYLWQMRECENMMTLEMAEQPVNLDVYASIDPYCFMQVQEYN